MHGSTDNGMSSANVGVHFISCIYMTPDEPLGLTLQLDLEEWHFRE